MCDDDKYTAKLVIYVLAMYFCILNGTRLVNFQFIDVLRNKTLYNERKRVIHLLNEPCVIYFVAIYNEFLSYNGAEEWKEMLEISNTLRFNEMETQNLRLDEFL